MYNNFDTAVYRLNVDKLKDENAVVYLNNAINCDELLKTSRSREIILEVETSNGILIARLYEISNNKLVFKYLGYKLTIGFNITIHKFDSIVIEDDSSSGGNAEITFDMPSEINMFNAEVK